jgi:MFS family permease
VLCVAQFVLVLDATVVTTALPSVGSALGLSPAGLTWVVTAYTLAFGGCLVLGGRLADLLGARRVLVVGLGLFVLASAACGLAWSGWALVAARVLQGLGASLMSPAALSLLGQVARGDRFRRRAIGWWTAAAATGGASGWLLGGLLTDQLGWRSVFWVNLPLGVAGLVAIRRSLPRGRVVRVARTDWPAAAGLTLALALLVLGLSSLGNAWWWAPVAAAVLLVTATVWREARVPEPLLPPSVLRSRSVAGASLSALLLTASTTPAMLLTAFYLQRVMDLSAGRASLLYPVFNVAVTVASLAGPAVLGVTGARLTSAVGLAGVACGAGLLVTLPGHPGVVVVLVAFVLMGSGLGVASVTSTHVGTAAAEATHEGVVSGVLTSAAQVGTTLGLALIAPLATGTSGYRTGFAAAAAIALSGLLVAALLPGRSAAARAGQHESYEEGAGHGDQDLLRQPVSRLALDPGVPGVDGGGEG